MVALDGGSVPEVVLDGEIGFVVGSSEGLPAAIERVHHIDPSRCRAHVAERFDVPRMVEGSEAVYRRVAASRHG